ncbi:GntR family transcriptional regulator [Deinococcus lacus]|uniref:GntR family transcriptional regulator n=1 Tax=Deinococcus lacus TaxID=392561 RepID=A0ABW1YDF0_9DEIO
MAKYPQIYQTIKRRLLSGTYAGGQALPSEPQLAAEFGVSRMTVRRAIDELERGGYLQRVQGAGTYATGSRFRQGKFEVRPFREWTRQGEHRLKVLRSLTLEATPEIASVLASKPGATVHFLHRLRLAGDEPQIIEKRYLNAALCGTLTEEEWGADSVHELLMARGVTITRLEQNLEAVNLQPEEAELLRLPVGAAAFLLRRTTYQGEQRVSYANYWLRSDRHAFQDSFDL